MFQLLFFIVLFYYGVTRGVPYLISYFILFRYSLNIQIGKLSLVHLRFENICFRKNEKTIRIESLGATSGLINSQERKILCLNLRDVRIEGTIDSDFTPVPIVEPSEEDNKYQIQTKAFKISPSVVTLAQFFGVHIYGISALFLEKQTGVIYLAESNNVDIEATTINQTNVALSVSCNNSHLKVLQSSIHHSKQKASADVLSSLSTELLNAAHDTDESEDQPPVLSSVMSTFTGSNAKEGKAKKVQRQPSYQPSLLECEVALKVKLEIGAEDSAVLEIVECELPSLTVTVRENLGYILQEKLHKNRPTNSNQSHKSENSNGKCSPLLEAYPKLVEKLIIYWSLVPQDLRFILTDATIIFISSSVRKCNVNAKIQNLEYFVNIPRNEHPFYNPEVTFPDHSISFNVDDFDLSTTYTSALSLSTFKLDTSLSNRKFHFESELLTLMYWYDYRDLMAFLPVLSSFKKSSTHKPRNVKLSTIVKNSYKSLDCVIRIRDLSLGFQLPNSPALYLLLYHSYLDTVRGTLLVEGLTSRLGRECCCVRPLKLHKCYCDSKSSCVSGKCLNRRNSTNVSSTPNDEFNYHEEGFLKVNEGEARRWSDSSHVINEEVTSNFLGDFGKQMYMKGVNRNAVVCRENSPFEDLKFLASERDENSKKQHVWGSPISIGICHFTLPNNAEVIPEQNMEKHTGSYQSGSLNRRNYGRMSSNQKRLLKTSSDGIGVRSSSYSKMSYNYVRDDEETLNLQTRNTRIELDDMQAEWSSTLANMICGAHTYMNEIKEIFNWSSEESTVDPISEQYSFLNELEVQCYNLDFFFHSKHDVSISLRVDGIKTLQPRTLIFSGLYARHFTPENKIYHCVESSAISIGSAIAELSHLSVTLVRREILLEVLETAQFHWSVELHLTILSILMDIKSINKLKKSNESKSPKAPLQLQVVVKGVVGLKARISTCTQMEWSVKGITYLTARGLVSIQVEDLNVQMDGHQIMNMIKCRLMSSFNSSELKKEREIFPELTQASNKGWKLIVSEWFITFPYRYDFGHSFHEKFISTVKWIRNVHRRIDENSATVKTLPPDIILSIHSWKVTVEDDPFEVKLRYNYELMEDEYQESCKRRKAFNSRINELQRSGAFLTASKVEELHKTLKEKDSETYIKRSKQMYDSTPARADVFTWTVQEASIFILADPSMDGVENAIHHMEDIDEASSLPDGATFSTLWCRVLSASLGKWNFMLRDYPQPLMEVTAFEWWGRLVGAELTPLCRGERTVLLPVSEPWHDGALKRSMCPRKYYHDFSWEAKTFTLAYGPCWEPAMSQFNIALGLITPHDVDPSLPMPWWDKVRLLYHGRVLLMADIFTLKLHASLDPYNTTEEMELSWTGLTLDWTNAKLHFAGDLAVSVRTASKYDDARLLSLTNLRLTLKLLWVCQGDPEDHHSVVKCAPDKLPEYSSNQEHDSFRAFRSRNLDINISLETKTLLKNNVKVNSEIEMLFYGSTLKWFENLKFILSGVTRPIKRGKVFKNTGPRKLRLSRHYRRIHLALSLQRFDVRYWMSVGVKKGFHLSGERLSLSSEHTLTLIPRNTGFRQRSLSKWSIVYLNTELCQAQVWLQSALSQASKENTPPGSPSSKSEANSSNNSGGVRPKSSEPRQPDSPSDSEILTNFGDVTDEESSQSEQDGDGFSNTSQVEKFYFLHVSKVAYMRETLTTDPLYVGGGSTATSESPNHRLVVYHLKGAWTTNNRDIVLALYDSWNKNQLLKHNLRPDVLQSVTPPSGGGKHNLGSTDLLSTSHCRTPRSGGAGGLPLEATPSPLSRLQSGSGAELLHQLIKEADNNYVAYSEDCSNTAEQSRDTSMLQGVTDCITDDVVSKRWLIELVNSQVLLKGCETQGYVIISAAKSQIIQRIHRPAWRQQTLNSKTTWYGSLDSMQYYATVSPGHKEMQMDNILWLSVANIEEKGEMSSQSNMMDLTDIVGSNQSAGGVVTDTVGAVSLDNNGCANVQDMQLQRIVSRCRCEFYYVSYGELGVEPQLLGEVQPPPPSTDELWGDHRDPTDTFTLMHHDLCISTNSLQYNMVVDILNKLLLYVDPVKKAASSDLARTRFKLQLSSGDDQKKPIVKLQNLIRYKLSELRGMEKDVYLLQRALDREEENPTQILVEKAALTKKVSQCKEKLNTLSDELAIRVHLFNETQLRANHKLSAAQGTKVTSIRINEVFFRKAQWRLTEADGQLGIAEVALSNFLYTKKTNSDDSGEHLLELGYVNMKNLLPNQVYTDALSPTTLTSTCPLDRQKTLRIFCREKAPCGGIVVIDHFEINVVPLDISLTYQFYKTILKFCFPDNAGVDDGQDVGGGRKQAMRKVQSSKQTPKETQFYVKLQKDDVEIMKQRAEQNKMFVYIKIPELKVRLSYKGIKEKNLTDVTNFRLVVPSFECHNVTWTWLDFLNALKENCKSALVPQLIKIKLNVGHKNTDSTAELDEEEKARLLLGDRHLPHSGKASKKNLFKFKR